MHCETMPVHDDEHQRPKYCHRCNRMNEAVRRHLKHKYRTSASINMPHLWSTLINHSNSKHILPLTLPLSPLSIQAQVRDAWTAVHFSCRKLSGCCWFKAHCSSWLPFTYCTVTHTHTHAQASA